MSNTTVTSRLLDGCGHCGKTETLLPCTGCDAMLYCNQEHQAAHVETHQQCCKSIKKCRKYCQKYEEASHQNLPVDISLDQYLDARMSWGYNLACLLTTRGHEEAIKHYMEVLRLGRLGPGNSWFNIHRFIAWTLFELDKDHDCYDFITAWVTAACRESDLAEDTMLYTRFRRASLLEAVELPWKSINDIRLVAPVILMKLKLLFDLQAMDTTTKVVGPKVPLEILDNIRFYVPSSSVILANPELLRSNDHSATIVILQQQTRSLYKKATEVRVHLTKELKQNDRHSIVSRHIKLDLEFSHNCWVVVPGATDYINKLQAEMEKYV